MTQGRNRSSLRYQTLKAVFLTLLALLLLLLLFSQTIVKTGFEAVETQEAIKNVERVRDAFDMQVESIAVKISDWSIWDDAYAFMQYRNQSFEESSLATTSLLSMKVDLFVWWLPDGTLRWGREFDLVQGKATEPRPIILDFLKGNPQLFSFKNESDQKAGIIDIPGLGLTFVAIQPVVKSDGSGPIAGALVAGRAMNEAMLKRINHVTHLEISMWPEASKPFPSLEEKISERLKDPKASEIVPLDSRNIAGYTKIYDMSGKAVALVRMLTTREIHAQGQTTLYSFMAALIFAGLCFGLVITWLLEKKVISRVVALAADIVDIRHKSDLSLRVAETGQDEISDLARSTNEMLASIERAQNEIASRNAEMSLILDNAEQGFLNVSLDGKVFGEMSAVVRTWMGGDETRAQFWDYVFGSGSEQAQIFKMWWDELVDGMMPFEVVAEQMPRRFERGSEVFQLLLRPVYLGSSVSSILAVISNITELVKAEALEHEQRESLKVFQGILTDKNAVLEYFTDSQERVKNLVEKSSLSRVAQMRELHTLKGNSAQIGIELFSRYCHELETLLIHDESRRLSKEEKASLSREWDKVESRFKPLTRDLTSNNIEIEPEELKTVTHMVNEQKPYIMISRILASWQLEPIYPRLQRLGKAAEEIAMRLGKGPIRIIIEDQSIRVDRFMLKDVWSNMIHVVRNAIDHGIEDPEQRLAAKKTAQGSITLAAELRDNQLIIRVQDDGQGIDWETIRQKALEKGWPAVSQSDLIQAVFSDGFSTKDEASEISGRGVGMAAVKAAVEGLQGRVEMSTEPGKGTVVSVLIPRESMEFSNPESFSDIKHAV